MKIGIYNEPEGGTLGGSEYMVGCLAASLQDDHQVDYLHRRTHMSPERLSALSGHDLTAIGFRHVPVEPNPFDPFKASLRSLRQARGWYRDLSTPYELFVASTHGVPPYCRAPHGVLIVLFPFFKRLSVWPWDPRSDGYNSPRARLRRRLYDWEWKRRFRSYRSILTISSYSQYWTKRWWDIDSEVLYPPVDTAAVAAPKRNRIVSVGRFTARGVLKKQIELMQAFRELEHSLASHWDYCTVGGVGDDADDLAYYERVVALGVTDSGRGHAIANLPGESLQALYSESKVFWHATGYGTSTDDDPQLAEHFGIATVEAMAAGCVPVVTGRGAQPEIVEHGVNGFVWQTLEELKQFTRLLAEDDVLCARMSDAARARAQTFSEEAFSRRFRAFASTGLRGVRL